MTDAAVREPTFLILTALAARAQHGYGILLDVEEISGGRVKLRAGTLYAALDRLCTDGWVAVDREEVVDGRLRRYYRLTDLGTARLEAEVKRLQAHTRMSTAERRYRRLLAWYPRDHRERNGEEMLGVLLAGSSDRRGPRWRETVDLLWGAVRMHLRRVHG